MFNSIKDLLCFLAESKESTDVKTSSGNTEREAGEVPDVPRALHRTLSIFFRHLAMQTAKGDLENVNHQYSLFVRRDQFACFVAL